MILTSIIRIKAIPSSLISLVVYTNWTWERHIMEITIWSSTQNHNLWISSNMIRCSLFSGQEYTEAEWNVYSFICLVCLFDKLYLCLFVWKSNLSKLQQKYSSWINSLCLMINIHIPNHFSNMLIHHFTFLWRPLPLLSSNWLSSGSFGTMYSTIVQCNACTYWSLFVC